MAQGAVAESPALHARWGNHRLEVDIDSSMWGVPDLDATDLGAQWSAKTCESHSETAPQRIQTLLIDDIDGGEAAGAVRFSLDGREYEIDLSATHSDELRKALEQYLAHARRHGQDRGPQPARQRQRRHRQGPRVGQGAGH